MFLFLTMYGDVKSQCTRSQSFEHIPYEQVYLFDLWASFLPVIYHSEFPPNSTTVIQSDLFDQKLKGDFKHDMEQVCCSLLNTTVPSSVATSHVNNTICKLKEQNYCTNVLECLSVSSYKDLLSLAVSATKSIQQKLYSLSDII